MCGVVLEVLDTEVVCEPSKSPLPGGFWVFLGSSRKGLAEIDRGFRVFFELALVRLRHNVEEGDVGHLH